MTRPRRLLTLAAVLTVMFGAGPAAAQTVMARRVPAGERVEVMLNGKSVGSTTADPAGEASVPFDLRGVTGKGEIDATIYVDHCETTHRVWIVEVGTEVPQGTCALRQVSGVYWVRSVSTIVLTDIGATVPSLLLLKGAYTPPPPGEEGVAAPDREAPGRGLVLFGGGGFVKTTEVTAPACGRVPDCTGDESGIGLTGGAEYRFNRVLAAEVSYLRPPAATTKGSGSTFRFDSEQNAHVFGIAGKVGIPAGIAKIYGRGGAIYHQAKIVTHESLDARTVTVDGVDQTIPDGTQAFELKTDGWGWLAGGGVEVWVSRSVALYGEFNYGTLKGDDINGGEAKIDNRLIAGLMGLRIHLGR